MNVEGLDALDNKILEVIKDNARLNYSDIGTMVGLSRVAVKNRMDAMEMFTGLHYGLRYDDISNLKFHITV